MKKFISLILSAIIFTLTLTSCANPGTSNTPSTSDTPAHTSSSTSSTTSAPTPVKREYTALLYDFADGIVGSGKDIDLSTKIVRKHFVPDRKLTINGNTYAGVYDESEESKFYNYDRDEYTYYDNNNGIKINYTINAATGDVESYGFYNYRDVSSDYEGRKIYSQEECLEIATEYMKQYIHNIEKYTLTSGKAENGLSGYGTQYTFKFKEYIGDLPIGNSINVSVTRYGDVRFFNYHITIEDTEKFKESGFLEAQDWDAIDEAIAKRACEAFPTLKDYDKYFSSCEYDADRTTKTLVRMKDGRYALQCQAYVKLIYKETGNFRRESVLLLVYLN
jgi:hypothetical protein